MNKFKRVGLFAEIGVKYLMHHTIFIYLFVIPLDIYLYLFI